MSLICYETRKGDRRYYVRYWDSDRRKAIEEALYCDTRDRGRELARGKDAEVRSWRNLPSGSREHAENPVTVEAAFAEAIAARQKKRGITEHHKTNLGRMADYFADWLEANFPTVRY